MGYDIELVDREDSPLPSEHFRDGGTHNIHGTNACELNVTYNYAEVLKMAEGFNLHDLSGKTAKETLPRLKDVVLALGGHDDCPPKPWKDYWAPTPGNALAAINRLIGFAEAHPEGTWRVS